MSSVAPAVSAGIVPGVVALLAAALPSLLPFVTGDAPARGAASGTGTGDFLPAWWGGSDATLILGAVGVYLVLSGLLARRQEPGRDAAASESADELRAAVASLDSLSTDFRALKEREAVLEKALADAEARLGAERARAESEDRTNAEVVNLLGLLQAKGRFIDFLMQDIGRFPDDKVGSVARFVHQGCRAVLTDHFAVSPVFEGREGETLAVKSGLDPRLFRTAGGTPGASSHGTVVHRGWKSDKVRIPRVTADRGAPFVIAPAEVELR